MNQIKRYLPLICILLLTTSCDRPPLVADKMLRKAETLLKQHPDSALALLDAIQSPMNLPKEQRYRYILLNENDRKKGAYLIRKFNEIVYGQATLSRMLQQHGHP